MGQNINKIFPVPVWWVLFLFGGGKVGEWGGGEVGG
jgi:hypothetical protein